MPSVPFPYGDAFLVQTPSIDRVTQTIYNEQRNRELLRQKQAAVLDDEFAKNMANIRDADVGDLSSAYGNWKTAYQQSLKQKSVSPEQQLDLLRRKAEVYKLINASKQARAEEEDIREQWMRNPDNFDDNAGAYLSVRRKTPLSQSQQPYADGSGNPINLWDYNTYRYKGSDFDFQKAESAAAGIPKPVYQEEQPEGLQYKVTSYSFGNTPAQFKESLYSSMQNPKGSRSAAALMSNITPEMVKQVDDAYNAIPESDLKKMGLDKRQELNPSNPDDKAERFASYKAKLYAINNRPKMGQISYRPNTDAIDKRNFDQQKQMEAIKDAHARQRLAIQNAYVKSRIDYRKAGNKKEQESVLEGYIQRAFDEGKEGRSAVYVKGNPVVARQIAVPVEITKKYTKGTPGKADEEVPVKFMMTEDKKYIVPIYPGKSSKDQTNHIPIEQFRNDLGKIWLTKKDATAEMADDLDFGDEGDEDQGEGSYIQSPTAAPQDDSYTRQELKSSGWTDEKINTAVKAGKIKVK